MIKIRKAELEDIDSVISLAKITWHDSYSNILSREQMDYMLEMFYSKQLLLEQWASPQHHFLVLEEDGILMGYSHCIELEDRVKLSKLYFLPQCQGRGYGKLLMAEVEKQVKDSGYGLMELFVNRGNKALYFYERIGFEIKEEKDIDIGNGFFMNDYRMEKRV